VGERIHGAPVPSVASLFVSRWNVAVAAKVPAALRGRLVIPTAKRTSRLVTRMRF
jgi:hypothetical protein